MTPKRWILLLFVVALAGWQAWEWTAPRQRVYIRDARGRALVHAWDVDSGLGTDEAGSFSYYRCAGSRTRRFAARGYRIQDVEITWRTREIVLEPGYLLRASIPDHLPVPNPPYWLVLDIEGKGPGNRALDEFFGTPGEDIRWSGVDSSTPRPLRFRGRTVEVLLPAPGDYAISWTLFHYEDTESGTSGSGYTPASVKPVSVTIDEGQTRETDVRLAIQRAQLGRAIRDLRR